MARFRTLTLPSTGEKHIIDLDSLIVRCLGNFAPYDVLIPSDSLHPLDFKRVAWSMCYALDESELGKLNSVEILDIEDSKLRNELHTLYPYREMLKTYWDVGGHSDFSYTDWHPADFPFAARDMKYATDSSIPFVIETGRFIYLVPVSALPFSDGVESFTTRYGRLTLENAKSRHCPDWSFRGDEHCAHPLKIRYLMNAEFRKESQGEDGQQR